MTAADDPSRPVLAPVGPMAGRRRLVAVVGFLLGLLAPGFGLPVALAALMCAALAWWGDGFSRLLSVLSAVLGGAVVFVFALPALFAAFP